MYFVLAMVMAAACGSPTFDPLIPFNFNHFGWHEGAKSLAPFLSFIAAFMLLPVLYFFIVQNTPMSDDYMFTTCFLHFVLSCIAMRGLPFFYDITGTAEFAYATSHGIWFACMVVFGCIAASMNEWTVLHLHDLITSIETNHWRAPL